MVKCVLGNGLLCLLLLDANAIAAEGSLKDPTAPLKAGSAKASTLTSAADDKQEPTYELMAIYRVGANVSAVVNGQVVQVGDRVNGALVKHIGANSVRLSGNEELELKLMPTVIKNKNVEPQYVDAE